MKTEILLPFRLEPLFVERIWGTADLNPWYDYRVTGEQQPIGEVWLTGDACKVADGDLAGKTLSEVFASHAAAMLGERAAGVMNDQSPLLLKVIFAKEKLSVQVHPDDKLAQKYGQPRGKTECWYALTAEPGAEVAVGLKPGTTLERSLTILPIAAGDMVFVDAGTVHAIWPGSVLLETQQNCDLTYRLFDYGRPRELHVAKAVEATRLKTDAGKVETIRLADRTVLVDREYFCVEKIDIDSVRTGESMTDEPTSRKDGIGKNGTGEATTTEPGLAYLFAAAGSGRIRASGAATFAPVDLPERGLVAIPATSPAWIIENLGGLELIRITPRFPTTV